MRILSDAAEKLRGLRDRISLNEDYQAVFDSVQGQRVLRHIMKSGNMAQSSFVQGDPHGTSFREGQRHLALSILRAYGRDTTELIKQVEQGLDT